MDDTYKEAYKEALAIAPKESVILETLEIDHPTLTEPFYLVNDDEAFTAKLEDGKEVTFRPVGFSFTMPKSGDSGVQELTIGIQDINNEATDFVLSIATSRTPASVKARPYLANDTSGPQITAPILLFLRGSSISPSGVVSAKASFADLLNRPFISQLYTRRLFPSLGT